MKQGGLRRAAFVAAKILFAAAVIAYLFHKVPVRTVWSHVRNASLPPLALGALLILGTVAIAGWRWRLLLRIFGIEIPLFSLICVAQVGQFFMMFLPGPAGDDLTRMLYISRLAPKHVGEACTTVIFDRLIGLASVLVLAVFCIPERWRILSQTHETYLLAGGMIVAACVAAALAAIFFAASERGAHRFLGLLLRVLPGAKLHGELIRMAGLLRTNKLAILKVIGAALCTQLLLCAVYFLAGLAVGVRAPLSAWFTFVPIVIAANAFPITVAGIGVREYLLVLFLGVLAGVPNETALAASFLVLGMTLAVCLFGGAVYIVYRPKQRSAPAA
jgi:uncharacterized protein (TIRG00374 family)